MKVKDIAQRIDARLHPNAGPDCTDVRRAYGADTMSDLIEHASPDTLLVTALNNAQLIRVAELMDVPGICLASGAEPSRELLDKARAVGTAVLTSPLGRVETLRLISECLAASGADQPRSAPPGADSDAPPGAGARAQ
jgi:hypothetical protein